MLRSEQTALIPTGLKFGLEAVLQLVWCDWPLNPHPRPITYTLLSILEFVAHFLFR